MSFTSLKQLRLGSMGQVIDNDGPFRRHPRFLLRALAITSAAIGMILAFATLMSALHRRFHMAPARLLSGVAMIPLAISILWHHVDLFTRRMPAPLLVLVDGLGFFAYLSLMIANGIIIKNYGGRYNSFGIAIMLTYNQFPWMVCCAIHAIVVLQNLPLCFSESRVCSRCRRESDSCIKPLTTRDDYSPLINRDSYADEPDAEANMHTAPNPTAIYGPQGSDCGSPKGA